MAADTALERVAGARRDLERLGALASGYKDAGAPHRRRIGIRWRGGKRRKGNGT